MELRYGDERFPWVKLKMPGGTHSTSLRFGVSIKTGRGIHFSGETGYDNGHYGTGSLAHAVLG